MAIDNEVKFKTSREDNNVVVAPYPFVNAVNNYLKLMSILTKKTIDELNPLLVLPSKNQEEIRLLLRQPELFETPIVEYLGAVIGEVKRSIIEQPDSPDLSVFEKYHLSSKEYDKVISIIQKDKSFYRNMGLFKNPVVKHGDIVKVSSIVGGLNPNELILVSIQAVSTNPSRPHATFFIFKNDNLQLKTRNKVPLVLLCDLTFEESERLHDLLQEQIEDNLTIALLIEVSKKAKANARQFIGIKEVIKHNKVG